MSPTYPYLTPDYPGIGGRFKQESEDFLVEEIPLYAPCGEGEHLYIMIEKRDMSTYEAMAQLSQRLGVKMRDIGAAGLKDRRGITRQMLSLGKVPKERLKGLQLPNLRVLWAEYHRNKLRRGHLLGNRFRIRVRGVQPLAREVVPEVLRILERRGVPNYFGIQRFGAHRNNHLAGKALILGDWKGFFQVVLGSPDRERDTPLIYQARSLFEAGKYREAAQRWPKEDWSFGHLPGNLLRRLEGVKGDFQKAAQFVPPSARQFFLNAYQSFLFNRSLARRMPQIDRIFEGDLAFLHRNGAVFRVEDARKERSRVQTFEISPSGPLWGSKMIRPSGREWEIEQRVLEEEGFEEEEIRNLLKRARLEGGRRPYRIPLQEVHYEFDDRDLILSFVLPPGSYATAVLRELMKTEELEW